MSDDDVRPNAVVQQAVSRGLWPRPGAPPRTISPATHLTPNPASTGTRHHAGKAVRHNRAPHRSTHVVNANRNAEHARGHRAEQAGRGRTAVHDVPLDRAQDTDESQQRLDVSRGSICRAISTAWVVTPCSRQHRSSRGPGELTTCTSNPRAFMNASWPWSSCSEIGTVTTWTSRSGREAPAGRGVSIMGLKPTGIAIRPQPASQGGLCCVRADGL